MASGRVEVRAEIHPAEPRKAERADMAGQSRQELQQDEPGTPFLVLLCHEMCVRGRLVLGRSVSSLANVRHYSLLLLSETTASSGQ